jgi:PAS domain S-box-containing protein
MPNRSSSVQAARALPEILISAFDALPHGVVVTDSRQADNPIVYVNAGFEALTGYAGAETIGRNCRFLQGSETDGAVVREMGQAVVDAAPFTGVVQNYRKDGTKFWNEITIRPIAVDAEPNRFYVGVQVDVTARLRLEERLRDSQKMEALGKLAGGIAHDFNNLLALILVNAELVGQECRLQEPVREAADDIINAVEAGSALIKRMLDFARGQVTQVEPVSVNRLVAKTAELLRRTIREPISLEVDLLDDDSTVVADCASFETALINLALNARDAMPNGGRIVVRTRLRPQALPGGREAVAILVSDNGCGMDQAALDQAFEPYFSTKGPERGSGLGLPMVYAFALQSGGRVSIASEVNEGTTVELLLPVANCRGAPGALPASAAAGRILLVEDEEKLRRTLALQLRRAGYVVEVAGTVADALELLRAHTPFNAIVSDIRLPGGASGIDLMRRVRSAGRNGGLLLMTGFSDELDGDASDLSDIEVLRKPFRSADFITAVESVIQPG